MKILVLTSLYPPHSLGGYELSCRDVVRRWRQRGHDVTVLTTTTRFAGVGDRPDDPQVHRRLEWYWAEHALHRPPPPERLRLERANIQRLTSLLEEVKPDVVSVWAMGGMSMSLLSTCLDRGQAMAVVVEDDWLVYGPQVDAWLSPWLTRPPIAGRIAAAVTGVPTAAPSLPASVPVAFASDYLRRRMLERGQVKVSTAEVVPLGIDPTDFPAKEPAERPWRGRLLCVGRVEPRKGFEAVVRALAELPDTTLELVGPSDPEYREHLERVAFEVGVDERFSTRVVPREQLAAIYADADALVFPSQWDEPFGLVPLEAMTQATPVIATRRGGSAEFLADETNCLEIPIDDPAAIAGAVRRLAADPGLRQRLVTAGLATSSELTVDRFADGLESVHVHAVTAAAHPAVATPRDRVESPSYDGSAPQITVVVSTHNRAGLLAGLLDALERQTDVDAEIAIVDNGSTDDTWRVISERAATTPSRLVGYRLGFHDGPGVPRNTAVASARAPVVAFTDDDCLPQPGWLRGLLDAFTAPAVVVVQGRTDAEPDAWQGPWSRTLQVTGLTGRYETANLACRRADFLTVGGFASRRLLDGRAFGEDVQLGAALARIGEVRFAAGAVVRHRIMPGTYRTFLDERTRLGGFPALVRDVPELRSSLVGGVFLSKRTLAVDAAVVAGAAAVVAQTAFPLLAVAPWAARCWRASAGRPGRPRVVRAAQVAVGDVVGLAALVKGSAKARRLVL